MVSERRDVDDVGIVGIDANLGDVLRLGEADLRPGLPGVRRLVRAVTLDDVAANVRFACADVDDVRARRSDGDGADRGARDEAVGDGAPRIAAVGRLPQAAAGRAHV